METKFGAATDDPKSIIERAKEDLEEALRENDNIKLRGAVDLAWLAASSAADVAADKLGMRIPGGANGRRAVYEKLTEGCGAKGLLSKFEMARETLHGKVYHGDEEYKPETIRHFFDEIEDLVIDAAEATKKCLRKKRK